MPSAHRIQSIGWRPTAEQLDGLQAIEAATGLRIRRLISEAVDEYLAANRELGQAADVAAFNRSAATVQRIADAEGLLREAAASR